MRQDHNLVRFYRGKERAPVFLIELPKATRVAIDWREIGLTVAFYGGIALAAALAVLVLISIL